MNRPLSPLPVSVLPSIRAPEIAPTTSPLLTLFPAWFPARRVPSDPRFTSIPWFWFPSSALPMTRDRGESRTNIPFQALSATRFPLTVVPAEDNTSTPSDWNATTSFLTVLAVTKVFGESLTSTPAEVSFSTPPAPILRIVTFRTTLRGAPRRPTPLRKKFAIVPFWMRTPR
jgi:hypothetical protein